MTALPQPSVSSQERFTKLRLKVGAGWAGGLGIQVYPPSPVCRREDTVRVGMRSEGPVPG